MCQDMPNVPAFRSVSRRAHFAAAAIAALVPTWAVQAQGTVWFLLESCDQIGTPALDACFGAGPRGDGVLVGTGLTGGSLGGTAQGGFDVPVVRVDAVGFVLPHFQFGTPSHESGHAVVGSGLDKVIIGGGTAGPLGGNPAGNFDAFFTLLDPDTGVRDWTLQIGTPGLDDATAVTSDGEGGMFGAMITDGSLVIPNAGEIDGVFIHVDVTGNLLSMNQFGTSLDDEPNAIAFDGSVVMLGGSTRGDLQGANLGGQDAFVFAVDPITGRGVWVEQFGTAQADSITAMFPDDLGGAFFTGITNGSLAGPNQGGTDIIVGHYASTGNRTWTRQFGTSADDEAHAIAPDGMGGFVVGGATRGSFDGLPNRGGWDAVIIWLEANGQVRLANQIGTPADDIISGLAPNGAGETLVMGTTWGSLGGPNAGLSDIFSARFRQPCYADCDPNGALDIFDFLCFQNAFVTGSWNACNCDPDPACDIFDFLCFQNAFVAGCP